MTRPQRPCGGCGQTDDHPRHVAGRVNRSGIVAAMPMHIDCCAEQGCAACQTTIIEAGGARGQELVDHLAAQRAARTIED